MLSDIMILVPALLRMRVLSSSFQPGALLGACARQWASIFVIKERNTRRLMDGEHPPLILPDTHNNLDAILSPVIGYNRSVCG